MSAETLRLVASNFTGLALAALIAWQGAGSAEASATPATVGAAPVAASMEPTAGSEANQLASSIAKDNAYQSVWSGSRDELDLLLSACSYVLVKEDRSLPNPTGLQQAKLFKPAMALATFYLKTHDFPEDFKARFQKHLDATRDDPRHGVRANLDELASKHDYAALAAWARPNDPTYLRELIAEQQSPLARHRHEAAETAAHRAGSTTSWLLDASVASERLSQLTEETREN